MSAARREPGLGGLFRRNRRLIDVALRAAYVVVLFIFTILRPIPADDAHAYWAVNVADPYTRPVATFDAFTYTPPVALFFGLLGHLPFEVFQALWTLLIGFALLWLAGPWSLLFVVIPGRRCGPCRSSRSRAVASGCSGTSREASGDGCSWPSERRPRSRPSPSLSRPTSGRSGPRTSSTPACPRTS